MMIASRAVMLLFGGLLTLSAATRAVAEENLDEGKSGAQLYAADCAICHRLSDGLSKAGGIFGLASFLREHYAASRESATIIADYLKTADIKKHTLSRRHASKRTQSAKPKTDKPKTDKPKTDKPKTDKSKTDKPKTEKPKTD